MDKNEAQLALVPENDTFILRLKKMIKNAEKTIDAIGEWCSLARIMFEIDEEFEEGLRRGLRIRVIVLNPKKEQLWRIVKEYAKYPNHKIKTLTMKKGILIGIFDRKEVNVICFSGKDFTESPVFWSNNANIVKMAQIYFDSMWSKASKYVFRTASSKQKAST